jgi:hypothetical protein
MIARSSPSVSTMGLVFMLLPPFIVKWYYGRYGDHLKAAAHG